MVEEDKTAYLGLGSNMGDPPGNLAEALKRLAKAPGIAILKKSSIYRTEPWGMKDQPWFANQVLQVSCAEHVGPHDLLAVCLGIEEDMGRKRDPDEPFGPRIIDIDILSFGGVVLDSPELTLPHPRLAERAFMLVPLLEISSKIILPNGLRPAEALQKLDFSVKGDKIFQV